MGRTTLAGASLGAGPAMAGALNAAPIVALCLGAAVLALGLAPRAVLPIGSLPAVGGFLLWVVTQNADAPDRVVALSPFAHVAAVPFTSPDWAGAAWLTGIAAAFAVAGVLAYTRRDLAL